MSIFLTKNEIVELTGYKYPGKQISWLSQQGFKFIVSSDCCPKVLRDHICQVLGSKEKISRQTRPNRAALMDYKKNGKK